MALSTSEVTQFKGTLLPRHQADAGRRHGTAVPPNRNTVGGLILHALDPLRSDLDALLAHDNRSAALRLAYNALAQVADALAASRAVRILLTWSIATCTVTPWTRFSPPKIPPARSFGA